jgi:hypothetical protein
MLPFYLRLDYHEVPSFQMPTNMYIELHSVRYVHPAQQTLNFLPLIIFRDE